MLQFVVDFLLGNSYITNSVLTPGKCAIILLNNFIIRGHSQTSHAMTPDPGQIV